MLKAVIFDLDATLLDWSGFEGDWESMSRQNLLPLHTHLSGNGHAMPDFEPFVAAINGRSIAAWESIESGQLDAPRLVDVMRDTLHHFGLDVRRVDVDDVLRYYEWGRVPGTRLYPDVLPVLRLLRAAGLRLGLLTNAYQPMWMRDRELRELGIEDAFDCRLSAADVGKLKPHPLPFERALDCLEATPDSAVFVGDSLKSDVAGAQGVGMRAVWRPDPTEPPPEDDLTLPDATVETLEELPALLDAWYEGWRDGV